MKRYGIGLAALLLATFGLLLVCEVVRPFHDPDKDMPLALFSWGTGTLVSVIGLFRAGGVRALLWLSLSANLAGLLFMAGIFLILRSGKLF